MKLSTLFVVIILFFISFPGIAQNVSINNDGSVPDPKAILDIKSNTKGILIPRMLQTERQAINLPPQGLIVYQTDAPEGLYYQAAVTGFVNWKRIIPTDGQYWVNSLNGDHIANGNTGNVGIGNYTPSLAGLVVDRKVDRVHAMFGTNNPGISIESNNPAIAFNTYYNSFRQPMSNGFGGLIGLDQTSGNFSFQNSAVAGTLFNPLALNNVMTITKDGNIGITGNTTPVVPLSFSSTTGNKISLFGSTTTSHYGLGVQSALLQMYTNVSAADIAFGYGSSTSFTENMRIKGTGNVGIGTNNPSNLLTVSFNGQGITQQSSDASTKIGFYTGGNAAYLQTVTNHPIYFATNNGTAQMTLSTTGNLGLEANTTPAIPLSFGNNVGNKIALYGNSVTSNYGLGIQGSLLQMYSSVVSADIAFGYGSSTSFTENMRIRGNGNVGIGNTTPTDKLQISTSSGNSGLSVTQSGSGLGGYFYANTGNALYAFNSSATQPVAFFQGTTALAALGNVGIGVTNPAFYLDMKGRARLRNDGATTPGIWFNKPDETQGSFIGQYDANNFGIWGPGASGNWNFLFDGSDGTLRIGTTQKATGYLVNVGGKVIAEEVRVQLRASWPDYVFGKNYKLLPMHDLEKFINQNKHLPGIPAAAEIDHKGIDLGDMQKKMMEKIEQLTLYIIDQDKRIELLEKKISETNK